MSKEANSKVLQVICADGETVEVGEELVRYSRTFSAMITDLEQRSVSATANQLVLPRTDSTLDDQSNNVISLKSAPIHADTLRKVVQWCKHQLETDSSKSKIPVRAGTGEPSGADDGTRALDKWQTEFLQMEIEQLFHLILAANYLDIDSLLSATSANVREELTGKTATDLRKLFKITLSDQEKDQMRKLFTIPDDIVQLERDNDPWS